MERNDRMKCTSRRHITTEHKRRSMLIPIALKLTVLTILSATGCTLFEHMEKGI